jgi:hypothetical protein
MCLAYPEGLLRLGEPSAGQVLVPLLGLHPDSNNTNEGNKHEDTKTS